MPSTRPIPRPEFTLTPHADELAIANAFSDLLDKIDVALPAKSRAKSLVLTKLQEAHFWAQVAAGESA